MSRSEESLPLFAEEEAQPQAPPAAYGAFCKEHLWLALRFYDLPLEALCRESEKPVAVVADEGGRQMVVACNQRANDAGAQAGLSLNAAYALVPELVVVSRDEAKETAILKRLGAWAKKYTPLVSLQLPEALLLEIKGSLHLFGGLEGLLEHVQQDVHALGLQHYYSVAPTPTAALWLSRHHGGLAAINGEQLTKLLGKLPLASTGWNDRTLTRLQGVGARSLRDCMRLPRDGFARRMGKQHLLELDCALGKAPDPRANYQPPDKFVAKREFLFALSKSDMILHGLNQLIKELTGFLCGRQSGIQTLTVRLYHQDAPATTIELAMVSVSRDEARLKSLLQQKFDQLTLPEAVLAVTMVSGILYPLAGSDRELFGGASEQAQHWPELVEKLRTRLGVRAVTGLCLVPEHRPEQAWQYAEPGTHSEAAPYRRRPLWVLSDPCRMPLRQNKPHWHGALKRLDGPERIESGWWDGQDVARDYFIVSNSQGLCLWIYRERGREHGCERGQQWYLHGIFA